MYKVKRSADTEARFDVNISVRRNATDSNVSMTLTGELSSTYQTTFGVHSVTVGIALDGRLDVAGPVGVASHVAYQFHLTAGSSITYTVEGDGGVLVNISAKATITHKLGQSATPIILRDCQSDYRFTF